MADFVDHCERGDLSEVRGAVGRGVDVNSVNLSGWSGLMRAVSNSHNQVVAWLLQQPAIDVSRRDRDGSTALYWAVGGNNPTLLSLLLAHPTADPTGRDNNGRTPLEDCRWELVGRGRRSGDIYRSCPSLHAECLRILEEDERRRQGDRQGGGRAAGVGVADRKLCLSLFIF